MTCLPLETESTRGDLEEQTSRTTGNRVAIKISIAKHRGAISLGQDVVVLRLRLAITGQDLLQNVGRDRYIANKSSISRHTLHLSVRGDFQVVSLKNKASLISYNDLGKREARVCLFMSETHRSINRGRQGNDSVKGKSREEKGGHGELHFDSGDWVELKDEVRLCRNLEKSVRCKEIKVMS